jgi:hypothetical protein
MIGRFLRWLFVPPPEPPLPPRPGERCLVSCHRCGARNVFDWDGRTGRIEGRGIVPPQGGTGAARPGVGQP